MISSASGADGPIHVALVNNMPDQALATTRSQFERLVVAGADGREINFRSYYVANVARSETARRYLERDHEDMDALYRRGADAMIVTGAEPRAARLQDEPIWPELQRLVDWSRNHTLSTIWSCLAAHAAVLHLDGIERRRRPSKISGVFACEQSAGDWSGAARKRSITVPHSRYNDVAREELERCGYSVSSHSAQIGVDSFWRREPSLFLFLQGHPEYDADTLLKEYRRDALRYVSGESTEYPERPAGCFGERAAEELRRVREDAETGRATDIEARLNAIIRTEKRQARWASDAGRLYSDWLRAVSRERSAWRNSA